MNLDVDALIVVSFGGPEKPEDVLPFLEIVTRGRRIPRERLLEVAEHYHHFGGKSPINDQNRALIAALQELFEREGPALPVYWGNRNWHPFLSETLAQMHADGIRRATAFITSAFGSYSGCRQYREDIGRAQAELGGNAPEILPLPLFYNNPGFVEPSTRNVRDALKEFGHPVHVAFTAHSVPAGMALTSPYVHQLEETCRLIVDRLGLTDWKLVYQSRSGPPSQPWLEPDILDYIRALHSSGRREMVVAPIGFTSDHMEVIYDLDTEAAALCQELGVRMVRARTVGTDPAFIRMIRDLLVSRRRCELGCCPAPWSAEPGGSARVRGPAPH
jgi:protoporphyrin/coproporphyrin ferrochelatase